MQNTKRRICLSTFLNSGYARQMLKGIGDALLRHDDWEIIYLSAQELAKDAGKAFDGYICDIWSEGIARRLYATGKPVVNTFVKKCGMRFPTVGPDQNSSIALGIEHFAERRFENLAFCGYAGVGFSELQRDAFLRQTADRAFTTFVYPSSRRKNQMGEVVTAMPVGQFEDVREVEAWIKTLPSPIAIICCNDLRAHDVLRTCQKLGRIIPDDVAILGADDDPVLCLISTPQLSSVIPNAYGIGVSAVDLLAELIDGTTSRDPQFRQTPASGLVSRKSTRNFKIEPKWLADAIAFIHSNATRGISAADVVTACGFSHTFVQKAFREKLGSSIQKEIAHVRLAEAQRLVERGGLSMSEIARRCGFSSLEYFSNRYAAAFGHSPGKAVSSGAQPTKEPQRIDNQNFV